MPHRQAALIDATRAALHLRSDYALGKLWDVNLPTLSRYRKGSLPFDPYMVTRVAEALDKDPREIQAELALEKKPLGERRTYWETLLKKLVGAASVGGYIVLCTATSDFIVAAPETMPLLDIMSNRLSRLLRRLTPA